MKVFYYFLRKKPRRMGRVFGFPNSKTIAGAIPVNNWILPDTKKPKRQPTTKKFKATLPREPHEISKYSDYTDKILQQIKYFNI